MKEFLKDFVVWAIGVVGLLIGFTAGVLTKENANPPMNVRAEVQAEAVKAGVGYYELDQKTGKIEFHYVDINRVIQSVVSQLSKQPGPGGVIQ